MSTQATRKKRRTAGAPPGFERMAALSVRIGFCPSAIYSWIANPQMGFPSAVKLGRNVAIFSTAAGQAAAGGGGGSGSRGISNRIMSGFSGTAVTVGTGGTGVSGGNGGTSSFGSFVSAPGGSGAVAGSSIAGPGFGQQGFGASFPSGSALLIGAPGLTAKPGVVYSSAVIFSGQGADSMYGQGGSAFGTSTASQSIAGNAANGPGAGGGGAGSTAGGPGAPGVVFIYEYS